MRTRLSVAAILALSPLTLSPLTLSSPAQAADWAGFRGTGDGVVATQSLPVKWSPTENLAWTATLPGYGQSSPVVWKDSIYITSVEGKHREKGFVAAFDASTGKEKWRHEFEPTQKADWSYFISKAAPTPVVDAAGVYCFFEGGNLLALTHDGKIRWERSLVKDYGTFAGDHGLGASPCQTADTVFVLVDTPGPSYLLAVEKATGKTRWKTDRDGKMSWASPVVTVRNGKPEIIVSSNGSVRAYDPATGKALWELTGLSGNTLPSACVDGDAVLVGAGVGRNGGDPKAAAKSNCCLTLTNDGGKPGYKVAWTAQSATASYASPLAYKGHAYFVNAAGVMYCLDLKTGEELYSERLPGTCWASPIAAADHIYFFGKDGRTTVVKAGPDIEIVASNRLWEPKAAPKEAPKAAPKESKEQGGRSGSGRGGSSMGDMDNLVYGVAATENAFFVRSGSKLYRIGK